MGRSEMNLGKQIRDPPSDILEDIDFESSVSVSASRSDTSFSEIDTEGSGVIKLSNKLSDNQIKLSHQSDLEMQDEISTEFLMQGTI